MARIEDILLPDVGGEAVEVIEICVSVGDSLEEEEAIITVETEKASMDIPATFAGKVVELKVAIGDKVKEGDVVCSMSKEDDSSQEESISSQPVVEKEEPKEEVSTPVIEEVKEEQSQVIETVIEDVFVPDIGEAGEVDVIEILVAVGDSVSDEEGLITLETEKATMDVPAPFMGTIKEILVECGDKVKEGSLIARMEKTIVVDTPKAVKKEQVEERVVVKTEAPTAAAKESNTKVVAATKNTNFHASPSIRRLAREFGVDLSLVNGSGRKNRIVKEDVKAYIKEVLSNPSCATLTAPTTANNSSSFGFNLPEIKEIDFSKFGDIETKELSRIQKISGPNLHRNWVAIPHVTQFDDADITEIEAFRKEQNALAAKQNADYKISPLVFVLKAVAKALAIHPNFNASLSSDGNSLVLKKYFHIAVAVDTPNGLVVPVIKDVDKKGFADIARELKEISDKARAGKLTATDMQGACFTISSLGGIGGTAFTPIINAPEVAILGLSKSEMKPKWNGETFEPRLTLPLSLSYDHRVIDGADGARFTTTLSKLLSDIRLLLM